MNTSKIFGSVSTCLTLLVSSSWISLAQPIATATKPSLASSNQKKIAPLAPRREIELSGGSRTPDIGLLFEERNTTATTNSRNMAVLIGTNYVGQCPGHSDPEGKAWFFSKINKPGANLRVIIRNITFGFSGYEKPYTNREYYSGDISEGFLVKFGSGHSDRHLAVRSGRNQFDYIIRNGEKFIASGQFSVNIGKEILTVERNTVPVLETICISHEGSTCKESIVQTSYQCK